MRKRLLWFIAVLMLLVLAGCSDTNENPTALMLMYDRVFKGVFWYMLIAGAFASAVAAVIVGARSRSGKLLLVLLLGGVFLHGCIAFFVVAPGRADHATKEAWEAARDEQATYNQKIHGYWVHTEEIIHECNYSSFSESATGCVYVTESCTYDEDGNRDCDYTPWFAYERTLIGVIEDNWQNPTITFASHLAPRDWQNNQYGLFGAWGKTPRVDFLFEDHPDWLRVKAAVDQGVVLPASYENKYLNWIHANDRDVYIQYGGNIPEYQQRGVLPRINPLYSTSEYDPVQFSAGINLSPDAYYHWQRTAHLWAGQAGQQVQASLILLFAKQSQVPDTYTWVNTSKAYLQDENVFGKNILPKNMVLVVCLVDEGLTVITECKLETGMFEGNNGLKQTVDNFSNIPFSPEAVFGNVHTSFQMNGTSYVLDEHGWKIPQITIEGGTIGASILNAFQRVEMEGKEYLRTSITPTAEQQAAIYGAEVTKVLTTMGGIYLLILGGLARALRRD